MYAVVPAETGIGVIGDPFLVCYGAANTTLMRNEVLLGCAEIDSARSYVTTADGRLLTTEEWEAAGRPAWLRQIHQSTVEGLLFPMMDDVESIRDAEGFLYSMPLLASLTLGTTGGSWYQQDADSTRNPYWLCRVEDLTDEGRELVRLLRRLYTRPVWLLTWLDT